MAALMSCLRDVSLLVYPRNGIVDPERTDEGYGDHLHAVLGLSNDLTAYKYRLFGKTL